MALSVFLIAFCRTHFECNLQFELSCSQKCPLNSYKSVLEHLQTPHSQIPLELHILEFLELLHEAVSVLQVQSSPVQPASQIEF